MKYFLAGVLVTILAIAIVKFWHEIKNDIKETSGDYFDFSIEDFKADMTFLNKAGDTVAYRSGKEGKWYVANCPAALDRMTELLVEEYHRSMKYKKEDGHDMPVLITTQR